MNATRAKPSSKFQLEVRDRKVILSFENDQVWSIPLDEVVLIGEYTTDHGPYVDDYFLVFYLADGRIVESTFYLKDINGSLAALSDALSCPIVNGLVRSTSFDSNVLWPPALEGRPLYDFTVKTPKGFWARLGHWVGLETITHDLTAEVNTYYRSRLVPNS